MHHPIADSTATNTPHQHKVKTNIYSSNRSETHIMQYTSFTTLTKERENVSNENRMKENFRTIIYRLRDVAPGGVEMILEDTDSSFDDGTNSNNGSSNIDGSSRHSTGTKSSNNSKEVHPLTHPLVFHYAVWSKDIKKVEYALKFLSNHCKHWKSNIGNINSTAYGTGTKISLDDSTHGDNDLYTIGNICTYQILVKAMKMKLQYPTIQSLACKVIEDSLFITCAEKRIAAYNSGVVQAVLDCMNTFPDKTVVQRNGCGSLLFLIWDSYTLAKKLIIKHNGHIPIINALRNFPNDVAIQRNACWLLCNISEMDGLQSYLLDCNALSVLGLAFQGYNIHGSVLIRSSASQAMSRLLHYENTYNPKGL